MSSPKVIKALLIESFDQQYLNSVYLSDIDECATGSHTCGNKPNSTCSNAEGSFECPCVFGYESSDNGKTCKGKHCPSKDFFHLIRSFFRIGDCQFTHSGSRSGRNLKRNLSTDCRVPSCSKAGS